MQRHGAFSPPTTQQASSPPSFNVQVRCMRNNIYTWHWGHWGEDTSQHNKEAKVHINYTLTACPSKLWLTFFLYKKGHCGLFSKKVTVIAWKSFTCITFPSCFTKAKSFKLEIFFQFLAMAKCVWQRDYTSKPLCRHNLPAKWEEIGFW